MNPPAAPPTPSVTERLQAVNGLIMNGRVDAAREALADIELSEANDPALLQQVAERYVHCARHADALRCHERAVQLAPQHPGYLFNLATSCIAVGELERAEALLDQAIGADPADFGAHLNRTMLRRWTTDDHHIDQLRPWLSRLPEAHPGRVPLSYALAKEHEDLGDDALSFHYVQQGAALRRRRLAYRVEGDVEAMARIAQQFDATLLSQRGAAVIDATRPWFVLGLPRSGTTLVERILGSHSQLQSLGEIDSFAFALMALASGPGGKLAAIERSTQIDFGELGAWYRRAIASFGVHADGLINKTPQNYLYLGLIHLALPDARVVHVRRHPLDSCYAMYKTLFRMGYPFSYSLEDLGHYYLAYHRLMAHWRATIPDSFIELDYESLVESQAEHTQRLLTHGGLPWEDACLDFHLNRTPSATASATQVREPVHRRSAGRWRVHAQRLAPLADFLSRHGVACD